MKNLTALTISLSLLMALLFLPAHPGIAQDTFPLCQRADSDPDGDGWGWENQQSCRMPTKQTSSSSKWKSCSNWAFRNYGPYQIRNNIWGSGNPGAGSQCTWANTVGSWGVDASHKDGNGWVKGYPQMWRGWSSGGGWTDNHGLGQKINDISESKVHWKFTSPNSGRYISLIDIYGHKSSHPGEVKPNLNVMIVPYNQDHTGYLTSERRFEKWDFLGRIPLGGFYYKIYHTTSKSWADHVYQLVLDPRRKDFTADLNKIFLWLRKNHHAFNSNWYLISVQAGWELIEGGDNFVTHKYSVSVSTDQRLLPPKALRLSETVHHNGSVTP